MSGGELRPGGIDLSTNVGGQRQLIERSIQRVIENRDQHRTENGYRKQSSNRETALLIPEASPDSDSGTAFITVVVKGATLMVMPRPITTTAGKKLAQ